MFQSRDLPADREAWPLIFRAVLGSPDPNGRQLNGIGGGISSLSKVCVVGPATKEGADVDYTFAAIGVKDDSVDFTSNCGNMTSAIGPYAVDCGLVETQVKQKSVTVRIHNTNTGKIIHSTFPLADDGRLDAKGQFEIDGVAGREAKIELDFLDPTYVSPLYVSAYNLLSWHVLTPDYSGSKTGKYLPTGNATDTLQGTPATCIDVGNPCVFVRAEGLGVEHGILPDAMDSHPDLLERLDAIRREASVRMGISADTASAPGSIPKIAMVAPAHQHKLSSGESMETESADIVVRAISVGQPHRAVPITVAMALAAASTLEGSTAHSCKSESSVDADGVTIAHPSGRLLVGAKFDSEGVPTSATVFRTARKVMDGKIYY